MPPPVSYTRICDVSPNASLVNIVVKLDYSTLFQNTIMVGDSTGTVKLKLAHGHLDTFSKDVDCFYSIKNALVFVIHDRIQIELSDRFSIITPVRQNFPINKSNNISAIDYYWRSDSIPISGS